MNFLKLLLLALVLIVPLSAENRNRIHNSMHLVETDDDGCSANSIAPHTLLTVEHCKITDKFSIDGKPAEVVKNIPDGNDHVMIVEKGVDFKDFISPNFRAPIVGEHVYEYGNPLAAELKDQYREGYATGKGPDGTDIFFLPVVAGESGAAIMDGYTIVGMVQMRNAFFCYSLPFKFTPEQIKEIQ